VNARGNDHEFLEVDEYQAWNALLQLNQLVLRSLDAALEVSDDISVTEFDVLITLYNAPGKRLGMTALAQAVLLSPSGLTHLVTRLERNRMLARTPDPADGRKFFTELTADGDEKLRQARLTHNRVLRQELFALTTLPERRTIARISDRVRARQS
jgi:DNA-binding MarR family transcriptional regulator